ncbi:MAG: hypothetical protein A2233_00720 [Candidatus Kerfeldbacteria bacterium RIFOXYA2_FULL_38_24]|uniref:Uncharacterized protein n=1 Tax=Candidatus Kerfeldbacteria bacterium RIFOXYB2_FULL_38_14 TaxID=1798547 RepID=A0A1G2BFS9_9BACT|nr:MAG: hypothetical protein A2233_00720 [Candidatus Kerfeldbacteria bacterium RIFOXYA2_FULL_38_24]OGY88078.1 MAG: hypothetical protein A2319_01450 [Candidatus Kerfeldbacteria bacterium RIFOXYB2_FULL_38_14]OGY88436.1 MAG: hypothetical protein A2458_02325 [Candidatus Kerfeldbacteria bacterium RIFOXYC2_FULL_38_9]
MSDITKRLRHADPNTLLAVLNDQQRKEVVWILSKHPELFNIFIKNLIQKIAATREKSNPQAQILVEEKIQLQHILYEEN